MKFSDLWRDFVSYEQRAFQFAFGKLLASSLSGFVAGAVLASVIWLAAYWFISLLSKG